ncbi:MAG: hypothetical protein LBQ09_10965 [Acidobacteriaceae bacterium]|jgi:hypothetical protein|nr:hypothetical protein [Acidobacteriaceae bacterium]
MARRDQALVLQQRATLISHRNTRLFTLLPLTILANVATGRALIVFNHDDKFEQHPRAFMAR